MESHIKEKRSKKYLYFIFVAAIILIFCGIFFYIHRRSISTIVENSDRGIGNIVDTVKDEVADPGPSSTTNTNTESSLPSKVNIKVPFLVQAPGANWDALHEDACEEASLIMIRHFLNGTSISSDVGEQEIQALIEWEGKNGYGVSITSEQLLTIARDYYGLKGGRVETNITVDDIKRELAADRPVIVPAAGKILPNPNFRNDGPLYHNLVVRGYDKNGFITNDPGTRKGEEFRYTFDGLFNAIHDWSVPDILQGAKTYLVFDK